LSVTELKKFNARTFSFNFIQKLPLRESVIIEFKIPSARNKCGVMKQKYFIIILSVIVTSIIAVSAVCWHSLEEIHYLKSFFPKQFTVEEAFYASALELIKISIISLPLILITGVGLCLLHLFNRNS